MSENYLLPIKDILSGKQNLNFDFDGQDYLASLAKEYNLNCTIDRPIKVSVHLIPQKTGILIQGRIAGIVTLTCDRCAEEYAQKISTEFDEFEVNPEADTSDFEDVEPLESRIIYDAKQNLVLDLGAVIWEEFLLAQPLKPLCQENCKGLCPICGTNLNLDSCHCQKDEGDPRLAVLRGLKIPPRKS